MSSQALKQKRDELNAEVKSAIDASKEETGRVRKLRKKLSSDMDSRDKENVMVKKFKVKRDEINTKIKPKIQKLNGLASSIASIRDSLGMPIERAKKELEKLEWKQQTEVMNVRAEEKIAKKIAELEEATKSGEGFFEKREELQQIKKELDSLKKESQTLHKTMIEHAEASENFHQQMKETQKKLRKLMPAFKKASKKINEVKKEADTAHKAFITEVNKGRDQEKVKEEKKLRKKVHGLKKKAIELMEQFKKGKKLSTDELQIIQSYGD